MSISSYKYYRFAKYLIIILLLLHELSLSLPRDNLTGKLLLRLFYVDRENNIPTLFNTFFIFFNSLICYAIACQKQVKHVVSWYIMTLTMGFLGFDEFCSFHEDLGVKFTSWSGVNEMQIIGIRLYWLWVVPYFILACMFLLSVMSLLVSLPNRIRWFMVLSGVIYISGAAGLESLAGWLSQYPDKYKFWISMELPIEEGMEMIGMALFGRSLLEYIETTDSCINIKLGHPEVDTVADSAKAQSQH